MNDIKLPLNEQEAFVLVGAIVVTAKDANEHESKLLKDVMIRLLDMIHDAGGPSDQLEKRFHKSLQKRQDSN